jgi:hypothetical protein
MNVLVVFAYSAPLANAVFLSLYTIITLAAVLMQNFMVCKASVRINLQQQFK